MTARVAPSSDRLALRALAQRLRPDTAGPAPIPLRAAGTGNFVRLAAPPPAPRTQPVRVISPGVPPPPDDVAGSGGWARLLEWCVVDVGCEVAILTDDRGLVIASAGVIDVDEAQGIAARLVIAFHQADRMAGRPSRVMAIQLDDRWLTGLRIEHDDGPLTLSVLAMKPLDEEVRAMVATALDRKAQAA